MGFTDRVGGLTTQKTKKGFLKEVEFKLSLEETSELQDVKLRRDSISIMGEQSLQKMGCHI